MWTDGRTKETCVVTRIEGGKAFVRPARWYDFARIKLKRWRSAAWERFEIIAEWCERMVHRDQEDDAVKKIMDDPELRKSATEYTAQMMRQVRDKKAEDADWPDVIE